MQVAKHSKESKEDFNIANNHLGYLVLEFDEAKYEIWESKMKVYLKAQGCDVWRSIMSGDTSTDESRRYTTKAMNFILSALANPIKSKVDQCSTTKILWKRLHNLYSKNDVDQDDDDPNQAKSQVEGDEEEEVELDMEKVLTGALIYLKNIEKVNHELKKVALLQLQVQEAKRKLEESFHQHEAKISQKQKELHAPYIEINRLKEWQKEHLQDIEKKVHIINEKDQDIAQLQLKEKKAGKAPCDKGTSSKSPQSKIDEKTDNRIPQKPNRNEGQKKVKNVAAPRSNVEAIKEKDQHRTVPPSRMNMSSRYLSTSNCYSFSCSYYGHMARDCRMYDKCDYERRYQNPRSKFARSRDKFQDYFARKKYVICSIIQAQH